MKEGFKDIDEILKEVSEEEKMSLKELKDIWKHQERYVKKQMDTEDVFAIFLPYIGTLSLNIKQFNSELKGKTRSVYSDFILKASKLLQHENYKMFANSHKKISGPNRLSRHIFRKYEVNIDNRRVIKHSKCWDLIYKYSNDVLKKKEE